MGRAKRVEIFTSSPSEGRITQKMLAQKLGFSIATVSRALAKSPLLPKSTIEKVLTEAKRLGYCPDPSLASLVAYRTSKRPLSSTRSLAWVTHVDPDQWNIYREELFNGAKARAKQLGYNLEPFSFSRPEMSPRNILKVLSYRKIEGLIFPPLPRAYRHMRIPLDHFSCISIGYTLYSPHLDIVTHSHFRDMTLAYRKLLSYGYRRIGLFLDAQVDKRNGGQWKGAYYVQQTKRNSPRIPALEIEDGDMRSLDAWLKRWKPDALIAHVWRDNFFDPLGISIPKDLGVVTIAGGSHRYAGIDQRVSELGVLAVNLVVSKIRNNERGIPKVRTFHLVEGAWRDGPSIFRKTKRITEISPEETF